MKIKELERLTNERLQKEGYTTKEKQCYFDDHNGIVTRVICDILKENGIELELYGYGEKRDLVLRFRDTDGSIYVAIRRKRGETKYNIGFYSTTYWYIENIKFYADEDETIEGIHDDLIKAKERKEKKEQKEIKEIINFMNKNNISYSEMEDLMYNFRRYNYKIQAMMEEK